MSTFIANPNNIDTCLSLYIPVIHSSVANIEYIQKVFHNKNIGRVYRVDFVRRKGNTNLLSAFIYLDWYKTNVVCYLQELIIKPDPRIQAKLFHSNDIKYFWIIIKNNNPKIVKPPAKERKNVITENKKLKKKVNELEDKLLSSLNICWKANEKNTQNEKTIENLTLELNSIKKTNDCIPDLYEEICELRESNIRLTESYEKICQLREFNDKLTKQIEVFKQQNSYSYNCTKCKVRIENIDGDIQNEGYISQLCFMCYMNS